MVGLLSALAYLGAVVGALVFVGGIAASTGAPQEAAIAGMALVIAFIPYALARLAGAAEQRKLTRELLEEIKRKGG